MILADSLRAKPLCLVKFIFVDSRICVANIKVDNKLENEFYKESHKMVGVAGFKPTTSPTPRVRANQAALYSVKELKRAL